MRQSPPPFVIYALPRSRTFWLSKFLTYGSWVCGHDELRFARSLDDVKSWFSQPFVGTVETAASPWWRLVQRYEPQIRTVVVRRPIEEVVESLLRCGLGPEDVLTRRMTALDRKLDQIEMRVPCLSVRFADLAEEPACADVFRYCLGQEHDPKWWAHCAPINLQINMAALVRYCRAFKPQMEKLAKIAKQQTIAGMWRDTGEIEGVTIQQEPFDTFLQDGKRLFEEHLVQVGEAPDQYMSKNIPLMRKLYELGMMQVTTARSNGRMFGYLMAIWAPSLESEDRTSAMHLTFYGSKEFPGLGMKLQRASIEGLRAKGIDELFMRAGTRGSGPKMSSLYRRLGAEDSGQMFMLDLKAA